MMNSRVKRKVRAWQLPREERTGWVKTTPYGDWREYHYDPYAEALASQLVQLKQTIPNGINPKRIGTKPWYKRILLQKQHQW